ncbi:MAG: hypothetical protein JST98_05915 [Bacteroidetes bacterium]|nr:hypothetical protein [Bacteroidota bacterium]MBS1944734.1 hypothetical protein [Bacteroidota bacterium]
MSKFFGPGQAAVTGNLPLPVKHGQMGETKRNLISKAFADLLNDDDAKALEALAVIHEQGDATAILPLLQALAATDDPLRQRRITALLYEVKVKDAPAELAKALDMPELLDVRNTAIAAFWNAGLDAGPYTERLLQIAVEGEADETFEVLTVVENQELLPEKAARKGLARVEKAAAAEKDAYKRTLLDNLAAVLKERLGMV